MEYIVEVQIVFWRSCPNIHTSYIALARYGDTWNDLFIAYEKYLQLHFVTGVHVCMCVFVSEQGSH